jgi:hypothetical protein
MTLKFHPSEHLDVFADNAALAFGTGSNSKIYYASGDTYWDLQATGTGGLMIALGDSPPAPDLDGVHIWKGNSGSITAPANTLLTVENATADGSNADCFITILGGTANDIGLYFGDSTGGANAGSIAYDTNSDRYKIFAGATIQLYWDAGTFAFQSQATTISTAVGDLILTGSGEIVDIRPTTAANQPRLRITSLNTAIDGSSETQLGSLDFYSSDTGNAGVHARILAYADSNVRMGLKVIVGGPGVDTERMNFRIDGEVGIANGAPKFLLGTPQTYGTTQPTNLLQLFAGNAPAGAVTNSVGLYTGGTVMSKIIADGTISNVEA